MTRRPDSDRLASYERSSALWDRFERTGQAADLEEAIFLLREVLARTSSEQAGRAAALSNLAAALVRRFERTGQTADLEEAISLLREVLARTSSIEPDRLTVLSSLGDALRLRIGQTGDPSDPDQNHQLHIFELEAFEVYQQVLEMRCRVLGEDHPDTLASINNLAAVMRQLGNLDASRELNERAFKAYRRVLGENHPDTLASRNNLATVLQDQGDLFGAWQLYQDVLSARERVLGKEHPSTLSSMSNLAAVLQELGDLPAARDLYARLLSARERVLGKEHPSTLASMERLAAVLQELGDIDAAQRLYADVVSSRQKPHDEEVTVTIVGDEAADQASVLRSWLANDPSLRIEEHPSRTDVEKPTFWEPLANSLVVSVHSSGTAALAAALIGWIRSARRDARVILSVPSKPPLEVSARRVRDLDDDAAQSLATELSRSIAAD